VDREVDDHLLDRARVGLDAAERRLANDDELDLLAGPPRTADRPHKPQPLGRWRTVEKII
jgi:hypothetical protein